MAIGNADQAVDVQVRLVPSRPDDAVEAPLEGRLAPGGGDDRDRPLRRSGVPLRRAQGGPSRPGSGDRDGDGPATSRDTCGIVRASS